MAGYLLVLAAVRFLILKPGHPVNLDDIQSFAFVVVVPLTMTFIYILGVFSFGFAGDVAARQSMYPARMLALPVTTAALAGWPMLYGTAAMAILWLATRLLAVFPSGVEVPMIWPAVLAADLLAWTLALTWMPYGLRGLRVIVTVLWLALIDAVVLLALHYKAPEPVMLAILAPHVPLAFLAARSAVARARRGDVPDWRGVFTRLGQLTDVLPRRRDHFISPARAQAWFEWRRLGQSLPALVGILLPFELGLLFLFTDTPPIVFHTLLGVLLTPPFMAAFAGATVSKSNPHGRDSYGLTPFMGARPLTSASLVAAKLKATIWSTLAAWLLVLVAVPLALNLSGTSHVVIERARQVIEALGTPHAAAIVLLGFLALLLSTWKQLVQSLYIGMSGREWVVKASVFLPLGFLAVIGPLARWIVSDRVVMAALWNTLPAITAVLVAFKISAAAWIAIRLHESRLVSDRTLVIGAACWSAIVFALFGVLAWLLPALLMRRYFLALIAILEIPLARLSAAPLALARNRHGDLHRRSGPILKSGRRVIGAVLIFISLPVVLVLTEAVSFHVRNRNNGSVISSGEKREYLLHVPGGYDRSKPAPLVISMHGAGLWPAHQMTVSQWNRLADSQGFIVVYPSGIEAVGPRIWHVDHGAGLARDVRFISDLIDELERDYNIDPARIYANGLSNGGGMAFVLSCALSDRIAAVGMVAAAQTLPWSWCADPRAVPMIAFHGTADPMVPYEGGASWVAAERFPDVSTWVANWARRNRCGPDPVESVVAADVSRSEYTNCAGDAAVVLYTLRGGGHTWPGGEALPEWFAGTTSRSVDATSQMWAFFREHPLLAK